MTDSLRVGLHARRSVVVDVPRTTDFLCDAFRVYTTPGIVNDMEFMCRDLLLPRLAPGQDTVGARVEIDHVAPALLGATVDISAEITAIDGRRITFAFTASDRVEEVARGRHVRCIVDIDAVARRVARKTAMPGEGGGGGERPGTRE